MTRDFPIAAILSVVGHRLLAPISGVHDILDFMTGEEIYTHQIPRAMGICRPELLRQNPQFAGYDDSSVTPENWREWLDSQTQIFGTSLRVAPLAIADGKQFDTPVADLIEMTGDATKVIVIEP